MSTTIFFALQCFQCFTMQVKQKKKSSSKWTCAVCNQKQSVRKVFAQAYMPKHLRNFVQSFNMSRKFSDQQEQEPLKFETLIPTSHSQTDVNIGFQEDQQRKRRMDWSEYVDADEENKKEEDEGEGDGFGPQIVTELPKEMFKKPKLRNYACGSGTGDNGGDNNLYKPIFSSRNSNKTVKSQDKESRKCQSIKTMGASNWSDYMIQDDEEARMTQRTKVITKASKWNDYVTQDDDDLSFGSGRNFADHTSQQSHNDWETILDDQKVEDDIHPDFM